MEVVLPALTKEDVFLDLEPYAIKSYNAQVANIITNAIDSEREGIVCTSACFCDP